MKLSDDWHGAIDVGHVAYFSIISVSSLAGASFGGAGWVALGILLLLGAEFVARYLNFAKCTGDRLKSITLFMWVARGMLAAVMLSVAVFSYLDKKGPAVAESRFNDTLSEHFKGTMVLPYFRTNDVLNKDAANGVLNRDAFEPRRPPLVMVYDSAKDRYVVLPLDRALQIMSYSLASVIGWFAPIAFVVCLLFFMMCVLVRFTEPDDSSNKVPPVGQGRTGRRKRLAHS